MKKRNKEERPCLLLSLVEKVYYRQVGWHRQRQGHRIESRVVNALSHVGRGKEEGRGGAKYCSQEAKGTKGVVPKMSGLYREEPLWERQPRPWAGESRVEGGACQPHPVMGRD